MDKKTIHIVSKEIKQDWILIEMAFHKILDYSQNEIQGRIKNPI